MPLRNVYILVIATFVSILCHVTARQHHSAKVVGEAVDLVNRFYVDPVDDRKLLDDAMKGMLQSLDQHSQYIPPDAYESFQDFLQQEFAGIGILVEQPDPAQPVRVITPLVGSPALAAGLLPGDEIVRIDGVDVSEMSLQDVSKRLRGPVDEEVRVGLRRGDGEQLQVTVRRGQISLESVVGDHRDAESGWVFRVREDPRIAFVRITSFGEKTVEEVRAALQELDNDFDALVLDLRDNAGGLLNAAIDVCDMFLDEGVIVTTRGRGDNILAAAKASPGSLVAPGKPMAVLINGESASASEIVAACLQDHDRATVLGTRSFGKGTVQNIMMMEYGRSALKLTTARYYRPSGRNIHRGREAKEEDVWGVMPDIVLDLSDEDRAQLVRRWHQATYPVLDTTDQSDMHDKEADKTETDTEPSAEAPTAGDEANDDEGEAAGDRNDRQLQRAIQALRAALAKRAA